MSARRRTLATAAALAACAAVLTAGTANAAPAPGGRVLQTITGNTVVAPGQPAYMYLDVTNGTGATLGKGWSDHLSFTALDPSGIQTFFDQVTLQANVWNGQAYVPVQAGGSLPALSKSLAPGATAVYRVRVDLVKYAATTAAGQLRLNVDDRAGDAADAGTDILTVRRDAQTGPHASASASAPASAVAVAVDTAAPAGSPSHAATARDASVTTPAASAVPATAAAAPATAATLAETGGGSDTGMLTGIALVLLSVGSAVVFALKRRASGR